MQYKDYYKILGVPPSASEEEIKNVKLSNMGSNEVVYLRDIVEVKRGLQDPPDKMAFSNTFLTVIYSL